MPPSSPPRRPYRVPSVERAMAIIDFLADHPGATLSTMAKHLGTTVNGVFRICQELTALGHLERDDVDKGFRLSPKLLSLGHRVLASNSLVGASVDLLQELRDDTGHTVGVGKRIDDHGVILECFPSHHAFRYVLEPGCSFILHTSAPGKALMAFLPECERERLLHRLDLVRFTPRTITTHDGMRFELEKIRSRRWASDAGEKLEGAHCVGAVVLDHRGYPVGAIWVTSPSSRLPDTDFPAMGERVVACADAISRRMGGA